ncbi:MAG: NADH-quinone oxidoreductase subunit M, partial [Anaeromyxobacteraceae bacterium]
MIRPDNVLVWATFLPVIGAASILALMAVRHFTGLPKRFLDQSARWITLVASFLMLVTAVMAWNWFDPKAAGLLVQGKATGVQMVSRAVWIRPFNVEWFVGVDGLSISMVLLTGLISFVAAIASMPWWQGGEKAVHLAGMDEDDHGHGHDEHHPKHFSVRMVPGYMILLLLLMTGMMGTFVALDMFLFYVFWEVMLLPMYFLIGVWGGPRREYAAIKFFLYTLAGSVLMLLAIIAVYYRSLPAQLADGTMSAKHTFNLLELAAQGRAGQFATAMPILGVAFTKIVFVAFFIGFAIKIPMFPFHTWLPDAHVEAPTPISMILAGVLLKMGGYGVLRICYPLFPAAAYELAWLVSGVGVVSMVYGAFAALAQKDFKRLVAYSSVSHMGYVLLGIGAWSATAGFQYNSDYWTMAMSGAMFQMIAHGISSAGMFFLVGVVYDRVHHRDLDKFGGLFARMPLY